jgi:hypothetical protein
MGLIRTAGAIWLAREVYRAERPPAVDYETDDPFIDFLVVVVLLCWAAAVVVVPVALFVAVFFT